MSKEKRELQPPPLKVTEKALEKSLESADITSEEKNKTIKEKTIDLDKALRRTNEKEVEEVTRNRVHAPRKVLLMTVRMMLTTVVDVHRNHRPREKNQPCSSDVSRHTRQHDVRNV